LIISIPESYSERVEWRGRPKMPVRYSRSFPTRGTHQEPVHVFLTDFGAGFLAACDPDRSQTRPENVLNSWELTQRIREHGRSAEDRAEQALKKTNEPLRYT